MLITGSGAPSFCLKYQSDIGDVGSVMNNVGSQPTRNTMKLGELALLRYQYFCTPKYCHSETPSRTLEDEDKAEVATLIISQKYNCV